MSRCRNGCDVLTETALQDQVERLLVYAELEPIESTCSTITFPRIGEASGLRAARRTSRMRLAEIDHKTPRHSWITATRVQPRCP